MIDPFLVAVTEDDDGRLEPVSLREKIRAVGAPPSTPLPPTVRYA